MAIYHYSVQLLSRSQAHSAVAAAAYRAGMILHDHRLGVTHNYAGKPEVVHTEILAPSNAPDWCHDREYFWNQVEAAEHRKDSQVAREINLALPRELNLKQCLHLLYGFCQEQFVDLGMVADVSVHWKPKNPHAHILLTTRTFDAEAGRFGLKNRDWNCKALLERQREAWAEHVNCALTKAGESSQVDHRSFEAQGIENRCPQIHLGRVVTALRRKKKKQSVPSHPRWLRYQKIEADNAEIAQLERQIHAEQQRLETAVRQQVELGHSAVLEQPDPVSADRFVVAPSVEKEERDAPALPQTDSATDSSTTLKPLRSTTPSTQALPQQPPSPPQLSPPSKPHSQPSVGMKTEQSSEQLAAQVLAVVEQISNLVAIEEKPFIGERYKFTRNGISSVSSRENLVWRKSDGTVQFNSKLSQAHLAVLLDELTQRKKSLHSLPQEQLEKIRQDHYRLHQHQRLKSQAKLPKQQER